MKYFGFENIYKTLEHLEPILIEKENATAIWVFLDLS